MNFFVFFFFAGFGDLGVLDSESFEDANSWHQACLWVEPSPRPALCVEALVREGLNADVIAALCPPKSMVYTSTSTNT